MAEAQPRAGAFSSPLPPPGPADIRAAPATAQSVKSRTSARGETVLLTLQRGWGVAPKWGWQKDPGDARPQWPSFVPSSNPAPSNSSHLQRLLVTGVAGGIERTYKEVYMVTCFSCDLQVIALFLRCIFISKLTENTTSFISFLLKVDEQGFPL